MTDLLKLLAAVAAGVVVAAGFVALAVPGGGDDLRILWSDQQYVLKGRDPYMVYAAWREERARGVAQSGSEALDPAVGPPHPSYPPWAYCTGIPMLGPADLDGAKLAYAVVHLAILGFTSWWVVRRCGGPAKFAPFAVAAVLAADGVCTTVAFGQFGLLAFGGLLLAYEADRRGLATVAGLALGVALFKPTLAGPFVLAFLVKQRWFAVAIAAAYTAVTAAVVWALTGTDPLTMLREMETAATEWKITGYTGRNDPAALLAGLGLPPRLALRLAVPLATAVALALMVAGRRLPMLTLFAVAAVVARLWVFHHHYDDVILLFVLFGLLRALGERRSRMAAVAFALLGVALWLPQSGTSGLIGSCDLWGNIWFDRTLLLVQVATLAVLVRVEMRVAPVLFNHG